MRLLVRLLLVVILLAVIGVAVAVSDLLFNGRRLTYAVLGRDALVAACRPVVLVKLKQAGFEPDDLEFGDAPDIAASTTTGRMLTDTVTFRDGASQTRVDGIVSCLVHGDSVTVDVRTRSTPMRAT